MAYSFPISMFQIHQFPYYHASALPSVHAFSGLCLPLLPHLPFPTLHPMLQGILSFAHSSKSIMHTWTGLAKERQNSALDPSLTTRPEL